MHTIVYSHWESPLGTLCVAAHDAGVLSLSFEMTKDELEEQYAGKRLLHHSESDKQAAARKVVENCLMALESYFSGDPSALDQLQVDPQGTPFQRAVWQAMRGIRSGHSTSYGVLANRIGRPKAARAVGAACGKNPIVLAIPCHRVLGASGSLTGFSAGIARKEALLQLEGISYRA